jgi:hypothetical protein
VRPAEDLTDIRDWSEGRSAKRRSVLSERRMRINEPVTQREFDYPEVRGLAGRSAEAAKEIKSLISASVERVKQGTPRQRDDGSGPD